MGNDKFMYNAYQQRSAHVNSEYTRTSGGWLGETVDILDVMLQFVA